MSTAQVPLPPKRRPGVVQLLGLDTNGVMNEMTKNRITPGAWLLLLQLLMNGAIWFFSGFVLMYYTAASILGGWLAVLPAVASGAFVSFVVSAAVLWFDRSVMTMDTSQMKRGFLPLLGRIFIAMVFTAMSALMLETMVFYTMAEHTIRQRETVAAQELIALAVSDTSNEYDIIIAQAEKQTAAIGMVKDEKQKKLDDYTGRRATERAELVERHNGITIPIQGDYDRAQQEYIEASKRFGYRKVPDKNNPGKFINVRIPVPYGKEDFKKTRDELATNLKEAQKKRDNELTSFDDESKKEVSRLENERDEAVEKIREQVGNNLHRLRVAKQMKIDELRRTKNPEDLDDLSRVHSKLWREDRSLPGYLAESMKIVKEGGWPGIILVSLMHLFFFCFELFPFLWKFTAGREREIVAYYSLGQTALRGNGDALALIQGLGYSDPHEYARDDHSRKIASRMREAIHNLREWLKRREAFVTSLAQLHPNRQPNYISYPEIQMALANWWINGPKGNGEESASQALEKYLQCLREAKASGAHTATWIEIVGDKFPDPANEKEPWTVSKERLRQDNWEDPHELIQKGLKAQREFGAQLRRIQKLHALMMAGVEAMIRKDDTVPKSQIEAFTRRYFVERMMAPIQTFHEQLEQIQQAGLPRPSLAENVGQLMAPDTSRIWRQEGRDLKALGWQGNEKALPSGSPSQEVSIHEEDLIDLDLEPETVTTAVVVEPSTTHAAVPEEAEVVQEETPEGPSDEAGEEQAPEDEKVKTGIFMAPDLAAEAQVSETTTAADGDNPPQS